MKIDFLPRPSRNFSRQQSPRVHTMEPVPVTFSDLLVDLVFMLAPFGTLLFVGLTFSSITSRFRSGSRHLLKRGAIVGAVGAAVTALVFLIEPDIALPGPGAYFVILAVFLASFAVAVSLSFVMHIRR